MPMGFDALLDKSSGYIVMYDIKHYTDMYTIHLRQVYRIIPKWP